MGILTFKTKVAEEAEAAQLAPAPDKLENVSRWKVVTSISGEDL